ncbi:MAG: prepilin peptidase [Actinomycetota bacterium]
MTPPRTTAPESSPTMTALAVTTGVILGWVVGGWAAPMFVVLGVLVVGVSEPDLRERRIPNRALLLAAPLLAAALLVAAIATGEPSHAAAAVGWAAFTAALFYVAAVAVPGGLGMGDVKLLAIAGVPLGWLGSDAVLGAAALGFAAAGVAGLLARRRGRWRTGVPFAPFYAGGVVLVVLLSGATS